MKTLLAFLILALSVIGCQKEKLGTRSLIVADHKVDCTGGAGPQKCLLTKEREDQPWEYFYGSIEGFDYQEGFEYVIEVTIYEIKNPPADASSKRYVLKRIISKK